MSDSQFILHFHFRGVHYAHIRPELDRARTILIDEALWPHSKTIDISVSNAEFIEDALTGLALRCKDGEVRTLASRGNTVVILKRRYRSRDFAPRKLIILNTESCADSSLVTSSEETSHKGDLP